jgi:O-antigen ligase
MHWLLIGYMFLFIHRPFEVWPALGDLHVERVYMAVTLAAWAVYPGKRWLPNPQHAAYAAFAAVVLACWCLSPWMDRSQPAVEDYFKVVVFYVLLVTTVHDEQALKRVVAAFLAVMAVYLAHSFREYLGGRYTYRMGIERMIGVDKTLGDPNSFGASIVFALPFVPALWRAGVGGKWGRYALVGYTGLSGLCVLLTGSRSSLLGLLLWGALLVVRGRHRWAWLTAAALAAPAVFVALPEELQTRFETIVDPSVGPKEAKQSGEGRLQGLQIGLLLWERNPLAGVGPGAWRPATGSTIESHNLYGQLVGELGTLGLVAFLAVLGCFWWNLRRVAAVRRQHPEWANDLVFQVASAVGTGVFLLLFMGNFGHNLFRFSWLWYGGFLIIARSCVELRVRELESQPAGDVFEEEADFPDEPAEWPDGWTAHAGHAPAGSAG